MPRHLKDSKENLSYLEKTFENIFAKWDKEFKDDDVIDLETMEVIPGNDLSGQVRTESPLHHKFGTLSTLDFRHLAKEDDNSNGSDCSGPSKPRRHHHTISHESKEDDDTSDAESLGSCSSDDEDHEFSDNSFICNDDTNTGEHHSQHNTRSNSEHIKLSTSTEEDDFSSTPETVDLPSSAVQHVPQRSPEHDGSDAESLGDDKWSNMETPESPLPHVNTDWGTGESDNELEVILLETTPEWFDNKDSTSATKSKLSKRIESKGRRFSTNSSMNSTTTSSTITAKNKMREDNNKQSGIKVHNVTCHDTSTLDCVVLLHDVSFPQARRSCNETVVHAPSSTHVSRHAHNTETQGSELESMSISASSGRSEGHHVVKQTLHNASFSRTGVERVLESTLHNASSSRTNAHPVVHQTMHNASSSRTGAQHVAEQTSHNASSSRSEVKGVVESTLHNVSSSRSNAHPVVQLTMHNASSSRSSAQHVVEQTSHNASSSRSNEHPVVQPTTHNASSSKTGAQHVVEQTLHNASANRSNVHPVVQPTTHNASFSRTGAQHVVEQTLHNASANRSNVHPVVQPPRHNALTSRSRAQHVVEETSYNASSSGSGVQHVTGQSIHNPSSSRSILNNTNNNALHRATTSCNVSSRRSGVESMVQQILHNTLSSISGNPPVAAQRIDGNVLSKGPLESRSSSNRHQETEVITPKSVRTCSTSCLTEALVISKDNLRQCSGSEVLDILLSPRALVIDGENVAERLERLRAAMIDPQEQSHALSSAHTTTCQPIREQEMIAPLIRDMGKRSIIPSKADGSSTPSKQYKPILDITDLSCIARSNSPTNSDDTSEDSPDGLNLDPTITSQGNLQCDITSNDSQTRRTVLTPKRSRAANQNRTYICASAPLTNQNTTFTVVPVPVANQENHSPVEAHYEERRNLHRAKLHNATFCVTTPPNGNNQLNQTQPLTSVPGDQHVSDVNNNQTTLFTSMDRASDEEFDLVTASSFASLNNSSIVGNLTLNDFLPRKPKRKQHDMHERPRERKQHERHRHKRSKLSTSDSASKTPALPIPSTGSHFRVFKNKNK